MILITGASGNNGTQIIKLLSEQRVHVRAMTRKQYDRDRTPIDNVEFVTADFDDVDYPSGKPKGSSRTMRTTVAAKRQTFQRRFKKSLATQPVRSKDSCVITRSFFRISDGSRALPRRKSPKT